MKLVGKIFALIGLVIASVVGIAFAFLEFRYLFEGAWTLMNNPSGDFIKCLFRGLFYLSIVATSVVTFVLLIKRKTSNVYVLAVCSTLLICSGFTIMYLEYYFALGVILAGVIIFAVNFIYLPKKEKEEPSIYS